MSKPTQGPWTIDSFGNIQTPKGVLRLKGVALPCGSVSDKSEVMANTRLIAAAPDLLEALEHLVAIVDIHQDATDNSFAWAEFVLANQAIAKAKGENE